MDTADEILHGEQGNNSSLQGFIMDIVRQTAPAPAAKRVYRYIMHTYEENLT